MGAKWKRGRIQRFWDKVDRGAHDDCWLWRGGARRGYGVFWIGKHRGDSRVIPAHRFAYEDRVGPIPSGLVIDHLCRTPLCMNPSHMEPVTIGENTRRGAAILTACLRGHPRSPEHGGLDRKGHYACRTCKNDARRARYVPGNQVRLDYPDCFVRTVVPA
jgi:hypothetical protein